LDKLLKKQYIAVLLLIGVCLTVFYPTLNSNVIDFDDTTMILNLNNPDKNYSVQDLFWPKHIGRYYRPLLICSFVIDSKIWLHEFSGYHLTNIVLHLLNALIFYFIAMIFFSDRSGTKTMPFFLAIGFVLHPLTVESVAWISGRTDILSAFFSLSTFLLYLSKLKYKPVFVSLLFLFGLLSKENAFCIFIIIPLCEIYFYYSNKGFKYSIFKALSWAGILSIPLFVYFYLRFAGFSLLHLQTQIQDVAVQGLHTQSGTSVISQMVSNFFTLPAIIAFYLKKLVWPFPLNFAISQINVVLYSFVSVVIGITSIVLVLKKKFYFPFWIVILILSFFSALPVALADVAWTRFAERYVYLSIPVICLFAGDLYYKNISKYPGKARIIKTAAFLILIVFIAGTVQRISVWKDKQSLWENTYKKNPLNGKVLYKYGSVLGEKEGLAYFKLAVEYAKNNEWKDFSLLRVARYEADNLNYMKAHDLIQQALKISPERRNCYQAAGILTQIMKDKKLKDDRYKRLLIQCYQFAYKRKPRPMDLYHLINVYKSSGDKLNQEKYYKLLQERFPNSRAARNLFKKYNPQ